MIGHFVSEGVLWLADLDWIVVRGVAGQVQKLAASPFDQLPHLSSLVGRQLIHDEHLPFFQFGKEDLLQIGFEDFLGRRAFDRHRRPHPLDRYTRQQGRALAPVTRHGQLQTLPFGGVAVHGSQRGVSATLVDEHQLPGVQHLCYQHPPSGPQELIAFCSRSAPFFLVESIRFMARHTVERLTSTDATARRYSHLSCRVRKGCSSRSAWSSFLERSSSFCLEPGLFLGASDRPSCASLA